MDSLRTREESDGQVGTISKGLGLFSLGLGLAEMAAPRVLAKAIGIEPDVRTRLTMRLFGARGIASGLGILAKPRRPIPVWSRVVGDAIDLAFLAWAFKSKRTHTERLVGAMVAVLGVTVLDAVTGAKLQKDQPPKVPQKKVLAVTINRPLQEVSQRWREVAGDIAEKGNVTFSTAPGGRGTEVRVEITMPSRIKKAVGRVLHNDVEQLADGDLRKVKQLIELGEIIHSDASIHRGLHAAQPSGKKGA
ncbi:MAG: hypothetical protein H0T42_01450 [Deltaproteobacteria bacterium]|nr:hypothetical protein [Deltaproteobacteria bacterium]